MQALIDWITGHLMEFWPIAVINSWQMGLRVRFGKVREELGPGLHWRWPFADEIYECDITEHTVDLRASSITTKDGQSITLSANIAYRIVSVQKMILHVGDLEESLGNMTLGFLASECAKRDAAAVMGHQRRIEKALARHVSRELDTWGVEIVRAFITDCVRARPIRLYMEA